MMKCCMPGLMIAWRFLHESCRCVGRELSSSTRAGQAAVVAGRVQLGLQASQAQILWMLLPKWLVVVIFFFQGPHCCLYCWPLKVWVYCLLCVMEFLYLLVFFEKWLWSSQNFFSWRLVVGRPLATKCVLWSWVVRMTTGRWSYPLRWWRRRIVATTMNCSSSLFW